MWNTCLFVGTFILQSSLTGFIPYSQMRKQNSIDEHETSNMNELNNLKCTDVLLNILSNKRACSQVTRDHRSISLLVNEICNTAHFHCGYQAGHYFFWTVPSSLMGKNWSCDVQPWQQRSPLKRSSSFIRMPETSFNWQILNNLTVSSCITCKDLVK